MKFSTVKDYGHTSLILIITFFNGLSVRGDGGMFKTLKWMQYLQSQRGNKNFLAYFPQMKVGLSHRQSVCLSVCVLPTNNFSTAW
jgi:hypothetical protein